METIIKIELLFLLLFLVGVGAYWKGSKDNIQLLRDVGKRWTVISLVLMVFGIFLK